MDKGVLKDLFSTLKNDNQCLLYNGTFSNDITTKVIGISEANQKNYNEQLKTQRRISYLMAECFQNIIRHGEKDVAEDVEPDDQSFFMNRNSSGKHTIFSSNLIKNENIENLKSHIDHLNNSDADELKALYKQTIKYGKISEKGGAGLGLIDMARKSGQNLEYLFVDFDATSSIFYNQIILNSEVKSREDGKHSEVSLKSAIGFHQVLQNENILMVQKGDFTQESIIPVLNIIEKSIMGKSSKSMKMKNVYKALVELLQNISKHAYSDQDDRDGVFALSKEGDDYVVSTGNCIELKHADDLEQHLSKLNTLSKDELEDLYTEVLMNDLDSESENPGLGLINLLQVSLKPVVFQFDKLNDSTAYFTIHATV